MTVDQNWLALQPGEEAGEGKVAPAADSSSDAPPTPMAQQEGRRRVQGGALSEIQPASPRLGAIGSGGSRRSFRAAASSAAGDPDGGGSGSRWAGGEGEEGEEEQQLVMQKHLAFSSTQVRRLTRCGLAWHVCARGWAVPPGCCAWLHNYFAATLQRPCSRFRCIFPPGAG